MLHWLHLNSDRRKGLLKYTLGPSIKMVGSLSKGGPTGLPLSKVDNLLHQSSTVSNYLGPEHGRYHESLETELVLREIVQDATRVNGLERAATLQLQEVIE